MGRNSISPEQSMELLITNAALLFLPAWPYPTEEMSGQGSCWRNKDILFFRLLGMITDQKYASFPFTIKFFD